MLVAFHGVFYLCPNQCTVGLYPMVFGFFISDTLDRGGLSPAGTDRVIVIRTVG